MVWIISAFNGIGRFLGQPLEILFTILPGRNPHEFHELLGEIALIGKAAGIGHPSDEIVVVDQFLTGGIDADFDDELGRVFLENTLETPLKLTYGQGRNFCQLADFNGLGI